MNVQPLIRFSRRGFTLIELLVVVGVIAILSAIAVPNFLEAQIRSKVSRVQNDMRTLATALEAYAVDTNTYPYTVSFFDPVPSKRLQPLTTPVSYLTSLPRDPFERKSQGTYERTVLSIDPSEPLDMYVYNIGTIDVGLGGGTDSTRRRQWSVASGGPDLLMEFPYYAFTPSFVRTNVHLAYIYDPTNGTVSRGEIFRRGGYQPDSIPGLRNY